MTESTALTTTTSNNQALAFLHDGAALDHRSRANKSGLLQGPISWKTKGQGDALEVTATAVMRETGEVITDRCECSSIDLSAGAAWRLGIPLDGIATVSIRY